MSTEKYPALDELMKGSANFREMMTVYSNEFPKAVARGRGPHLFKALRCYLDLVEVSLPDYIRRDALESPHD